MKKVISVGAASAICAGLLSAAAMIGAGTAAAAPDVVGMKYSDAKKEIRDAGGRAVIAARVGDKLDEDSCIVTNVWDASFLRIDSSDRNEMSVALNCAGEYATATNPGASVASPLGSAAKSKAEQEAAEEEEQELAEAATPGA